MGVLREMGIFDEVSLYGALIHVVAQEIEPHRAQIEAAFRAAGIEIRTMDIIAPSLEDVFIASVREGNAPERTGEDR
jgi:hypothetical protein